MSVCVCVPVLHLLILLTMQNKQYVFIENPMFVWMFNKGLIEVETPLDVLELKPLTSAFI